MKTALLAASASFFLAACSLPAGSSSSGTHSSSDDVKATGSLSGDVVASVSGATVIMVANEAGAPSKVQMTLSASLSGGELGITTPSPSSLEDADLSILFELTDIPSAGTYTKDSALVGPDFSALLIYSMKDNAGTGSFGAGKQSQSATDTLTLGVTSTALTTATTSVDLYAVHGSIDAGMSGGTLTTMGVSTPGQLTLHLDF